MHELNDDLEKFTQSAQQILDLHDLLGAENFRFSEAAVDSAKNGNWNLAAQEHKNNIDHVLQGMLSDSHRFLDEPYVQKIELPVGGEISVGIINEQSREWYGRQDAVTAFDFVYEQQRGLFKNCSSFLDLGGHQLIWSTFYARTSENASVIAFEPSLLNALIGLFNCLMNGVIDRVKVVPFAVACEGQAIESDDSEKMLVDFMTVPLKTCHLREYAAGAFDFIKVDIEGYEFELLTDSYFKALLQHAKKTHFELHLGHLIKRGISVQNCVDALKGAGVSGTELYTSVEMYKFLSTCEIDGYFSFVISG